MLQAFPFQRFGAVTGRVRSISSTVLGPTEISIPGISVQEPVFRVRVCARWESISAYGETISAAAGHALVGRRRVRPPLAARSGCSIPSTL